MAHKITDHSRVNRKAAIKVTRREGKKAAAENE